MAVPILRRLKLLEAVKADECHIYTDVNGVYTTDPRVEPNARRMSQVTFAEMLELASLGAKVLHIRSVEAAGKHNVPLRVLSSFYPDAGTLISFEESDMPGNVVSGIAFNRDECLINVEGVLSGTQYLAKILKLFADNGIEIDMINQVNHNVDKVDYAFTVHTNDYLHALDVLTRAASSVNSTKYFWVNNSR